MHVKVERIVLTSPVSYTEQLHLFPVLGCFHLRTRRFSISASGTDVEISIYSQLIMFILRSRLRRTCLLWGEACVRAQASGITERISSKRRALVTKASGSQGLESCHVTKIMSRDTNQASTNGYWVWCHKTHTT
jgi:hypothetical protein